MHKSLPSIRSLSLPFIFIRLDPAFLFALTTLCYTLLVILNLFPLFRSSISFSTFLLSLDLSLFLSMFFLRRYLLMELLDMAFNHHDSVFLSISRRWERLNCIEATFPFTLRLMSSGLTVKMSHFFFSFKNLWPVCLSLLSSLSLLVTLI